MMRSSNLVFLSFCTLAAGFSFTGVPSTATVNEASSATLILNNGDSTSFSLLLRLVTNNGGDIIQTFQSEQETSIPFSFKPTQTGSFIIEVISNLQPISDNQEPDKVFASSSKFNVVAANEDQSSPPTTTSSSSPDDTNSSSSSRNTDSASSTSVSGSQNTAGGNSGNTGQGSSTISTSPAQASSGGSSSSAVSRTNSPVASITSSLSSASGSAGAQGALASTPSGGTSPSASNLGSSGSGGTTANPASTETSPGSTVTSAPTGATSTSSKTGMIVGVVFGVLAFVAICLALLIAYIRYRRRKRTIAFERQLMFRQGGSSPLVFENVTASHLTSSGGDGYREYSPDSDMVERGRGEAQPVSVYSQQSVPSEYSDSPSVFYTAVPRAVGTSMSNNAPAPSTPPPNMPLPPVPIPTHGSAVGLQAGSIPSSSSSSTPSFSAATSTPASAPPPLPQLAPGWVFPRNPDIRRSQLPPPKTDRQMDIYDRKVRLQGKLIGMQGWGNMHASDDEKSEMGMLKEQIRRLELLENSDWALGKSNELPPELSYS